MKRFCIAILCLFGMIQGIHAQIVLYIIDVQSDSRYRISSGIMDIGKNYGGADSVQVVSGDYFNLIRQRGTSLEKVDVKDIEGRYSFDDLFERAIHVEPFRENVKGGKVRLSEPSAIKINKASDSTLVRFTSKLQSIVTHEKESYDELGDIHLSVDGLTVNVTNMSTNKLFVDIIWMENRNCYSALSYAYDYAALNYLDVGESRVYRLDTYVIDKELFVVCTNVPVRYNTINLDEYANRDLSKDIDIQLTIKRTPTIIASVKRQ